MDAISKDKRFAQIAKDPRFHRMKRKDRMVKIDKRFHGMFEDDRFKLKYTVDKRGRPVRKTTSEDLQKYYDLSDSEEEGAEGSTGSEESDSETEEVTKKKTKLKPEKKKKSKNDDSSEKQTVKTKTKDERIKNTKPDTNEGKKGKVGEKGKMVETEEQSESEEGGEESEDEEESQDEGVDLARGQGNEETSDSSEDDSDEEEEDLARGEGNIETSSSDDSDSENFADDKFDHKWGELDKTATPTEEITCRLAVCNMDWDRVKAKDLFVLLSSFMPTGGVIKSVSVYPSEFGKERLAEEDVKGPKELVEHGEEEEVEEGSQLQREKMRQYQLARLKYYYAVLECDSAQTANAIYEECDGIEYESSATRMDLRFIPDDMTFDDRPTSVATSLPEVATYKPSHFTTTALQQSKVDLTWDETDRDRTAVTMRKFTKDELEDLDMKDYLASSSGSEDDEDPYGGGFIEQPTFGSADKEDNDEAGLDQYKEILKVAKRKEKKEKKNDIEMEISWDPNLIEEAEEKKRKKAEGPDTPWEQFLNKKKEKKKGKKKTENTKDVSEPQESEKDKKNNKNKNKKKEVTKVEEEDDEDSDSEGEAEEAFSDDDLPSDMDLGDDYFKEEMEQGAQEEKETTGNKKKKGRKRKELSEEDKKSKAALSLLLMDEEDDRQHFSLKGIMEKEGANLSKTKKKKLKRIKKKLEKEGVKQVEDTFNVDVSDPRFADIYNNPHYNIDPSASEYKATKATSALIGEKLKRRAQGASGGATAKKRPLGGGSETPAAKQARTDENEKKTGEVGANKDLALASLVKSVKAKTQTLNKKKQR